MIIVSHPTGNTFSRALLKTLDKAGELQSFYTTLCFDNSSWWVRMAPGGLRAELCRRTFDVPREKLFTRPLREAVRLASQRFGMRFLLRHETGFGSVDAVYGDLDRFVSHRLLRESRKQLPSVVYCYEDSARLSFRASRKIGAKCCYDLPIAYWKTSRRILDEEAQRLPEWEPTLVGTRDSQEKFERKTEELALADVVVCPSEFVLNSLPEDTKREKTCVVAKFGTPEVKFAARPPRNAQRLRVLFAGSMTQRKGLADVFSAMQLLNRKDVELVVMGSPVVPLDFYRKQFPGFTYEHPRPHDKVLELMRSCDILVLPSLVEGRALVQQEAMACGLPLLVTFNAGGSDLVKEGQTGFLVPIRAPDKIAEKLNWFADNRDRLDEMGNSARVTAEELTWDSYGKSILDAITKSNIPECIHA